MVFGRAFWVLLPWQAPRARPGAFGTDLGSPLEARVGGDGLGSREDEWRRDAWLPWKIRRMDPSVLQDANEHFGRALRGFLEALSSHLWWQHHILIARDHTFRLRLLLPRKNA